MKKLAVLILLVILCVASCRTYTVYVENSDTGGTDTLQQRRVIFDKK